MRKHMVLFLLMQARHVLLVRYDMGGGQQTLYEPNVDVADGQYHIVQFVRDGAFAILRTDLEFERINKAKGKFAFQLCVHMLRIWFGSIAAPYMLMFL